MKKGLNLLLIVFTIIVVTGCGNKSKLTCTKEQTFGTVTLNQTIEYTFKKDYATESKLNIVATFDSEDTAESFAKNYDNQADYDVKIDGKKVTVSQVQKVADDAKNSDANKKDAVKESTEAEGFTCK